MIDDLELNLSSHIDKVTAYKMDEFFCIKNDDFNIYLRLEKEEAINLANYILKAFED